MVGSPMCADYGIVSRHRLHLLIIRVGPPNPPRDRVLGHDTAHICQSPGPTDVDTHASAKRDSEILRENRCVWTQTRTAMVLVLRV